MMQTLLRNSAICVRSREVQLEYEDQAHCPSTDRAFL